MKSTPKERYYKIKALFDGAKTPGEKAAAYAALKRINYTEPSNEKFDKLKSHIKSTSNNTFGWIIGIHKVLSHYKFVKNVVSGPNIIYFNPDFAAHIIINTSSSTWSCNNIRGSSSEDLTKFLQEELVPR